MHRRTYPDFEQEVEMHPHFYLEQDMVTKFVQENPTLNEQKSALGEVGDSLGNTTVQPDTQFQWLPIAVQEKLQQIFKGIFYVFISINIAHNKLFTGIF